VITVHRDFNGICVSRRHVLSTRHLVCPGARGATVGPAFGILDSTLWSLLIEEIYYAGYPPLRRPLRRFGWTPVLSVAFAALWIRNEISYSRHTDTPRWLSAAGA